MTGNVQAATEVIEAIPRSDGLAIVGFFLFIISLFFPWMSATDDRLIIDGEATTSMAGWLATDVRILIAVVLLCLILAVVVRVYLDEPRYTMAFIAIAGGFIVIQTGVYLVDPFIGLTSSALHQSGVYAGVGVYIAFIGGLLILGGVYDANRSRPPQKSF